MQFRTTKSRINLRIALFLHNCGRARLSAVPATKLIVLTARLEVVPSRIMF
jgi:hypothetical protein